MNEDFKTSQLSFGGYVQASYLLPGDINADLSGWYNSGELEGIIDGEWLYGMDIGFSKKFLDNKLKVSLGVENVLHRFFHGEVKYANIDMSIISKWDAPIANLQISYKFGNQYMKEDKRHQSGASDVINRAQK